MKRVVGISIGSSARDHRVTVEHLGQRIQIERMGTDGDIGKAARLYAELDGQVDAMGVGGTDLALRIADRVYPFSQMLRMVAGATHTPVVDGSGLKYTVERRVIQVVERELGDQISPKTCLVTSGADRYGMAESAVQAGYQTLFGDLMFGLGVPIALKSLGSLQRMGRVIGPVVTRLPFEWLYPVGDRQDEIRPKWARAYRWASVIAGDFHYVHRHMPADMTGKVIVTNTTTASDVVSLRERGVAYLVTTTPRLDGRSFGTNVMEAVLVALAGKGRALTLPEIDEMLERLGYAPCIERL
ncbi:MAG: quinate 5-dehydrogenase [Anaerolineae bacterium]|nr:quinate 5-dehydrogenase [Anaerolineae bacterium]